MEGEEYMDLMSKVPVVIDNVRPRPIILEGIRSDEGRLCRRRKATGRI
jgi:hypothetical protein